MNVKLTLEYDGTNYAGWQLQPNARSVQGALEEALRRLLGYRVRVHGAGRTDAGVHALGQVANFRCAEGTDLGRLQQGANALLRPDIVVKRAEAAPDGFDARRHARSRVYRYRIWNERWPSAFEHRFAWHVRAPLDLNAMRQAIAAIEGEHDFASFRAAGCGAGHAVRTILRNSVERQGPLVIYTIEANAFLRHMVRNLVGTLVEIGQGEADPAWLRELLAARDRTRAGPTAPAHGLFLVEVRYE